jgi:hypothetical protein
VSATSAIAVAPDGVSRYPLTRETEPPGRRWLAPWFPPVGSVALALASAGHAAARAGCRHRPGPHGLPACGAARAIGGTNNKDSGSSGSPDSTMDGVSESKRQAESAVVRRLYSLRFQTHTEWKGRSCSTLPVLSTLTEIIQHGSPPVSLQVEVFWTVMDCLLTGRSPVRVLFAELNRPTLDACWWK